MFGWQGLQELAGFLCRLLTCADVAAEVARATAEGTAFGHVVIKEDARAAVDVFMQMDAPGFQGALRDLPVATGLAPQPPRSHTRGLQDAGDGSL